MRISTKCAECNKEISADGEFISVLQDQAFRDGWQQVAYATKHHIEDEWRCEEHHLTPIRVQKEDASTSTP